MFWKMFRKTLHVQWKLPYQNNKTITIKGGEIRHLFSTNIIPDENFDNNNLQLGYMEDYFLDEQSQLEKRIAIGDTDIFKDMSVPKKKTLERHHLRYSESNVNS